jgi:hypothetical protein
MALFAVLRLRSLASLAQPAIPCHLGGAVRRKCFVQVVVSLKVTALDKNATDHQELQQIVPSFPGSQGTPVPVQHEQQHEHARFQVGIS